MKVLAILLVTLASMIVGCSLAADVTPPPAEEIATTMVAATAELESTVAVALQETQEQLATLPPQEDAAQTLESATEEKVTALHNWEFRYDFTPNSIELSSQYAPETKNIQSLRVNFTPTIKNIPASVVKHEGFFDGVFKQTLGFNMHEYSTNRLDVSLADHVIEIPRAKTGFKMDINITIAAESTGGETDTFELADAFTRPDDYYPSPMLSVPESLNIDLSRYDYYEIPDPTAQAIMLATIGGTWDKDWYDTPVRKPTMPLRIGLFGKVYPEDYETVRDLLEVLAVVAPSLDIGFATDLNQVTFPIHLVDCTEQLQQAWTNCRVDGPRGEYVSVEYHDQDFYKYDMFDNAWGYLYISRQGVNRHTLTHEMAHAFGLHHWNIDDCRMGPGYAQSSNWTAFELMTLAAIYDSSAVTNGQTRDDMRAALSIPIDTTWNDYVNSPDLLSTTPADIWVQFGRELAIQADEAIKNSTQSLEAK